MTFLLGADATLANSTTAPASPSPGPELGSRLLHLTEPMIEGADVKAWQRIIRTEPLTGRVRLDESGMFGPMTDTVTRIWQVEHQLEPDGIVGPHTLAAARQVTEAELVARPTPSLAEVRAVIERRKAKERRP